MDDAAATRVLHPSTDGSALAVIFRRKTPNNDFLESSPLGILF